MGKEYSSALYKKSYGGDYMKSYHMSQEQQKLYKQWEEEYRRISKKIGTERYSKQEKGKPHDGLLTAEKSSADTVYAEGRRRKSMSPRERERLNKPSAPSPVQQNEAQPSSPNTPPPYAAQGTTPNTGSSTTANSRKQSTSASAGNAPVSPVTEKKDDYSYLNSGDIRVPVLHLYGDVYKNIHTGKEINGAEARKLLDRDGFVPKKLIGTKTFFFICLLIFFPLQILGPFALLIWGGLMNSKSKTIMTKNVQGVMQQCEVAATKQERSEYSRRGTLYISSAFVIGFLQYLIWF